MKVTSKRKRGNEQEVTRKRKRGRGRRGATTCKDGEDEDIFGVGQGPALEMQEARVIDEGSGISRDAPPPPRAPALPAGLLPVCGDCVDCVGASVHTRESAHGIKCLAASRYGPGKWLLILPSTARHRPGRSGKDGGKPEPERTGGMP